MKRKVTVERNNLGSGEYVGRRAGGLFIAGYIEGLERVGLFFPDDYFTCRGTPIFKPGDDRLG